MKFSIKGLSSKCDQIRRKLRIRLHLLKKSLMENVILRAVNIKLFFAGERVCVCVWGREGGGGGEWGVIEFHFDL